MDNIRNAAIERLLSGYRRYYNVTRFDGGPNPPPEEFKGICEAGKLTPPAMSGDSCFVALCEYYEKAEQYFLFRTNELWSTHQEEFIFLFSVNNLTKELFEQCRDYAYEEGMKLAHIGPGHMYTYITPVLVCETAEPEAVKALEKCKIYDAGSQRRKYEAEESQKQNEEDLHRILKGIKVGLVIVHRIIDGLNGNLDHRHLAGSLYQHTHLVLESLPLHIRQDPHEVHGNTAKTCLSIYDAVTSHITEHRRNELVYGSSGEHCHRRRNGFLR